jgi:hypothetical protein
MSTFAAPLPATRSQEYAPGTVAAEVRNAASRIVCVGMAETWTGPEGPDYQLMRRMEARVRLCVEAGQIIFDELLIAEEMHAEVGNEVV